MAIPEHDEVLFAHLQDARRGILTAHAAVYAHLRIDGVVEVLYLDIDPT